MGTQVKILVVDDSSAVRATLQSVLNSHPQLQVVGTAADGEKAIAAVEELQPDLVSMDLEMPVMDGLTATREIKSRWPSIPIMVFSSLSARGSAASIQALAAGASECLLKPKAASPEEAVQLINRDIVPLILALAGRADRPTPTVTPARAPLGTGGVEAVVIGSSTGGPMALHPVLSGIGALSVPVLIVQHMPPMFTAELARRLAEQCRLDVAEAGDGEVLQAGMVRVAPGGLHLEVARAGAQVVTRLTAAPPVNNCRPAVDPLFTSAAKAYGGRLVGVVLTGMGNDGTVGARAVVEAGGTVVAQDEETSVVWGMPGSVVAAGLAAEVLPLPMIGSTVRRMATRTPVASGG